MVVAASIQTAARAALTAAGSIAGGKDSDTHNFKQAPALGLGVTAVTHRLLHRPVPVRLLDLSQKTAPAFPASLVGQAPQGSSLDALASMAASSAEHHRTNAWGGLPPAMARTPTLKDCTDVPSAGPCRLIGDQGGPWTRQDNTGLPPHPLDMSLQAPQALAPRADTDRRASVLSLQATQAHAMCSEIDRRASVLILSFLQAHSQATQARALCEEVGRRASVLVQSYLSVSHSGLLSSQLLPSALPRNT